MSVKLDEGSRKKRRGKIDAVSVCLWLAAAGVLIGAVFMMRKGLDEYGAMADMVTTWKQIEHIAESEPDPQGPSHFVETSSRDDPADDGDPGEDDRRPSGGTLVDMSQPPADDLLYKQVNLTALRDVNDDVSGYIVVPNTDISYPILKDPGPGKYYYLRKNIYKNYDVYGSIFELSDAERDGNSGKPSGIDWIFGHNMSSGAMFAQLHRYRTDPSYWDNPVYIYRSWYRTEYEVFGWVIINENDMAYDFGRYPIGSDAYVELLEHLFEKDGMGKTAKADWPGRWDHITVLSTCYGGSGTSQRMLLLLRDVRMAAAMPEL